MNMNAIRIWTCSLSLVGGAAIAQAQFVAIADSFSTTGPLAGSTPDSGAGNWTAISGSPALEVENGQVTIAASSGEAAQLDFRSDTGSFKTGTFYYGFDFMVSASGSISTSDTVQAIAGFRQSTAASGTYAVGFGTFRPTTNASNHSSIPSTGTSEVVAGIFAGFSLNASSNPLTAWSSSLNRGETYRVVLGFNLDADTLSLWLNPTSMASTSVTLTGISAEARGIFLRQGAASHGEIQIDNVVVQTEFLPAAAIPEPAAFAWFAALGALGLAVTRRRCRDRAVHA
jgi:hypothetical protein